MMDVRGSEVALQFKLKLLNKDKTIKKEIDFLNNNAISGEVTLLIEELAREYLLNIINIGDDFFFDTVTKVDILDKNFYTHMADIVKLYSNNLSAEERERILAEKIDLPVNIFKNAQNRNILFSFIVSLTIKQNNPLLIKKAIDKIQTFN